MEEIEFQEKVLKGVETLEAENTKRKSDHQKVLDDLDRSDKEVKKAIEEITLLKKTCNDQAQVIAAMQKAQKAVHMCAVSSFGDPIQRVLFGNDELKVYLNAMARVKYMNDKSFPSEWKKALEGSNEQQKALTGVDSSLGQATVPQATFNQIYDTLLQYGQWPTLGVQRVGVRTTVLPVATARPMFYWIGSGSGVGESSAITEGTFAGGSVNLIIQTLAAYLLCARELLEDSSVDLSAYILQQMVQSIAFGMDTAAFNGTGVADQTNAGYVGLFQAAQENTNLAAIAAAGNTTVENLQLEDFVNVQTTVSPEVLQREAKWWVHPTILAKLILIRDKNGRPIFQTWQEVPKPGAIGSILGYPVIQTAVAPSTDAAGNPVMAFGDPQGEAVGIRSDLELATSDDIKFAENMRAFRALMRAGFKIKTKANSTTLKPFAVLTLAAN